jgi:hypothetical protein
MPRVAVPVTLIISILVGALAGYLDLRYANLAVTMSCLVIGMLIVGFIEPDWWWLGSLVAGLSVIGAHVAQTAFNISIGPGFQTDTLAALLSVMPALLGGLAGAAIRKGPRGDEQEPRM